MLGRHERHGRLLDARQVVHEVVERRQGPCHGVAEDGIEPPLQFAGKERDAHLLGQLELGVLPAQHRDHTRHMEAADCHLDALRPQGPGNVEGSGKLVGLDTDQHHQRPVGGKAIRGYRTNIDDRVGLIDRLDIGAPRGSQHLPRQRIADEAMDRGQGV